jgi:hypothetical protein
MLEEVRGTLQHPESIAPVVCPDVIRIRRGTALEVERARPGVLSIVVEVEGTKARAIAYEELTGPIEPDDTLILNTGAVALGLGTGGVHFVVAVEGGTDVDPVGDGHAMKLRYTPVQHAVLPVEETHRGHIDAFSGLDGFPIIVASLHSAVAPACIAAKIARPEAHVAFVMTDGGALPIAFSETVAALKDAALLDVTITTGQAFGGDLEAATLWTGLLAAREILGADAIVVADGPGNLGTATRWGVSALASGNALNAAHVLGGRPVAALRVSFADARDRHRGVSHHTLTALGRLALARAVVAVPVLDDPALAAAVDRQLDEAGVGARHELVRVAGPPPAELLAAWGLEVTTMGRGPAQDPLFFAAAAAAGTLAMANVDGANLTAEQVADRFALPR